MNTKNDGNSHDPTKHGTTNKRTTMDMPARADHVVFLYTVFCCLAVGCQSIDSHPTFLTFLIKAHPPMLMVLFPTPNSTCAHAHWLILFAINANNRAKGGNKDGNENGRTQMLYFEVHIHGIKGSGEYTPGSN